MSGKYRWICFGVFISTLPSPKSCIKDKFLPFLGRGFSFIEDGEDGEYYAYKRIDKTTRIVVEVEPSQSKDALNSVIGICPRLQPREANGNFPKLPIRS